MSDDSEPLTTESPLPISHRGILIKMLIVIAAGAAVASAFFSAKAGLGVLIGGILGFANYFWQKHSLKAIFDRAIAGKRTRFLAVRYILRYVVLGGALAIVYFTSTVSIYSVIFGLASFAIAVMLEGITSLFSGSKGQET
jgi:hypothetical protein